MTEETANKVYDILVEYAGAYEGDRDSFVFHQCSDNPPSEWRFGGHLGFGGKFWKGWK